MIDGMKERDIPPVSLDLPEIRGNPPQTDVLTASTAYIRFHGRNKEAWWGSQRSARYDYLYQDEEIEAWAGRIQGLAEQAQRILVYFNNHPGGKSARNAQTLEKILRKIGLLT